MKTGRLILILLGVIVIFIAIYSFWASRKLSRLEEKNFKELPNFQMIASADAAPATISRENLKGQPWIASFIFTSCQGPCPLIVARTLHLQRTLPASIRLVSFSVDPDRDTPKVLADYAAKVGADPNRWYFLTGDKGGLYKLMYEGFNLPLVEDPQAPSGFRVTHSAKFVLVDAQGRIRGYYESSDGAALENLKNDARSLLGG